MGSQARLTVGLILTAICGWGVVVVGTPQNLVLFLAWLVAAFWKVRRNSTSRLWTALHGALMLVIVVAASLAPVKHVDALQRQTVDLPARKMTVRELSDFCRYNRDALPLLIRIPSNGPSAASEIQFSAQTLTLKEFIREAKNHTKCQPDFVGCGNAYSILYGPTYNFGLKFVPRPEFGYRW